MKGAPEGYHPRTDVSYFPTEAFVRKYGEQEAVEQSQKVKAGTWEMRLPPTPSPPEPPKFVKTTTPMNSDTEEQKEEIKKPETPQQWADRVVEAFAKEPAEGERTLTPVELAIGAVVLGIFFVGIYKGAKELWQCLSGATSM